MIPYLEGFSKRMELVACIASVLCRRNRNREIESRFDGNEMDNIIFSVLIHIMERTLTDERKCTLEDIEMFLSDILPCYQKHLSPEQLRELTRYIVKDILQNKGEGFSFGIMEYMEGKMKNQSVRLIKDMVDDDDEICYVLEKQGFDMLFRSKEVDDELGFQMEEIRLEKLIKKGNYSEASAQSSALIRMLNEKRSEILLFERRLRYDQSSTSGEEFDAIIHSIHAMLHDEYETMQEIRRTLDRAHGQIAAQTALTEKQTFEIAEAKQHLFCIERNVTTILQKQRQLLSQSSQLGEIYQQILRESLLTHRIHCFDMEKTILQPLEQYDENNRHEISALYAMLMNPLMLPEIPHTLGIDLFYRPQEMREIVQGDDVESTEPLEDNAKVSDYIHRRNTAHTETIRLLLQYASTHSSPFLLKDFWNFCCEQCDTALLAEEKRFFLVMLRLFELGCVDVTAWKEEPHFDNECQGEFDLSWSLTQIMETDSSLYGIRRITIKPSGEVVNLEAEFRDTMTGLRCRETIEMHNLSFSTEVENNA